MVFTAPPGHAPPAPPGPAPQPLLVPNLMPPRACSFGNLSLPKQQISEEEERERIEKLQAEHRRQKEALRGNADAERKRLFLLLDQHAKQQELQLSQQYNEQLMRLQQRAQVERAELENRANSETLAYHTKKVEEEYKAQQAGIQKQFEEMQAKLAAESQKLGPPTGFLGIGTATSLGGSSFVAPVGGTSVSIVPDRGMPPMAGVTLPPWMAPLPVPAAPAPTMTSYAAPVLGPSSASFPAAPVGTGMLPYVPPSSSSFHCGGSRNPSYVPPVGIVTPRGSWAPPVPMM